jgi:hypothetical protein
MLTPAPFGTNDLIEIEVMEFRASARVRFVDGDKIHVALEQGGYIPWLSEPVQVRRSGDAAARCWDAQILHAGGVTLLLEVLGKTPTSSSRLPYDTLNDEIELQS